MGCEILELGGDETILNVELLRALNYIINGRWHQVSLPSTAPTYLDTLLARDMLVGDPLLYDDNHMSWPSPSWATRKAHTSGFFIRYPFCLSRFECHTASSFVLSLFPKYIKTTLDILVILL
jgi:hypothetical protein